MHILDFLEAKRDGKNLPAHAMEAFVAGFTSGDIPDYQAAAFLMASCINGLDKDETTALTQAMLASGERLEWADLDMPVADKHSTGGVGDKTSLVIAPVCAACGVAIPMLAGRGLGHTGGTLDKLEAIPGYDVRMSLEAFRKQVRTVGCAIIGQTEEIAPADRKLYSLRDATGTVPNIGLISASIMSKKLAEGLDTLVMDVKAGSGAFMQELDDARELARTMVSIGEAAGVKMGVMITGMDEPLGNSVGNRLEVIEAVDILRGLEHPSSAALRQVCVDLSGLILYLSGIETDYDSARQKVQMTMYSGAAYEKFVQMVAAQGGDADALQDYTRMAAAKQVYELKAGEDGFVSVCNARLVGQGCVRLGAGRMTMEDGIDHSVGVVVKKRGGDMVLAGDVLAEVHYNTQSQLDAALPVLEQAWPISVFPAPLPKLVHERIGFESGGIRVG